MARVSDRRYLTGEIFPVLAACGGKVLFVGCRLYTRHYPALLEQGGAECWTLDRDPAVARWGAPNRHIVGPIQEAPAHVLPASFDIVVLSGVFGYGLDNSSDQEAALCASRRLLQEDGWFVLGWNNDLCADPAALPSLERHFRPASLGGLPLRKTFADSTHVFDFFTAAPLVAPSAELSGPVGAPDRTNLS